MQFNSLQFFLFFPLVTLGYFLLPHRFRWIWLLAASCAFYMAFVPIYILILGATIVVDYVAGILIERAPKSRKRLYLTLSLCSNLGILGVFKYGTFLIENTNAALAMFGSTRALPLLRIILPIGLSFHTSPSHGLHDRGLSRATEGGASLRVVCALCHVLPPARRWTDRTPARTSCRSSRRSTPSNTGT